MSDETDKAEIIQGLRELADWLEATPEADITVYGIDCQNYGATKEDVLALARTEGAFEKNYVGGYFELIRRFTGGVTYIMNAAREEVCTAVVVGTETVTVPDPAAPKVEVERDVVEWKCHPLLARSE